MSDPGVLNLIFSGTVLAVGLVAYWFVRPEIFKTHEFTERGFEFWQAKWLMFLVIWGLLGSAPNLRWALAASDLNSIAAFGFAITIFAGDKYSERPTIVNLLFTFGLLLAWNLSLASKVAGTVQPLSWWWIAPSMAASTLGLLGMASMALLRYKRHAVGFALTSVLYVVLQMPSYEIIFLKTLKVDRSWLVWLAFAKLLYGLSFYSFCFLEPTVLGPLSMPDWGFTSNPRIRDASKWVLIALLGGILAGIGRYCGDWIMRHVPYHTAALGA